MQRRLDGRFLRPNLLNSASAAALACAAIAFSGTLLTPQAALAVDVVCTPDASGVAIASAAEACSGVGDKIDYATIPAAVISTVTLSGVTIATPALSTVNGVSIAGGTFNQTLNALTPVSSITSVGGDGINILTTTGNITVGLGAATLRATGLGGFDGVDLGSAGGNIVVTAAGTIIDNIALDALNTGAGIRALTTGAGTVSITTSGAGTIGNIVGTTLDHGIIATSGTGAVTIVNTSQIGFSAAAADVVDVLGISAVTTGNISISNSGTIFGNVAISGLNATGTTATTTVLVTGGGGVTSGAGDSILASAPLSTGLVTVGTSASRINATVTADGGATNVTANGINARGLGDVSVFTGAVPITSRSNGGGTWAIRATSNAANLATGVGGAVVVDAQGPLTGTGTSAAGILANTGGFDTSDTVTVITTGLINSPNGTAIDARSFNGNATVTASGNVIGGNGTGNDGGINILVTGTGKASATTLGGATVTGNSTGAAVSHAFVLSAGSGGLAVDVGGNATSVGGNAIKTTNTTALGTNTINIGTAAIRAAGASATSAIIDMTSASGGLTTLTTAAGTTIFSSSVTSDLQNADLAIRGTGGSIVVNNGGSIRGRMDFSGITVATNTVTLESTSALGWHTSGTSTFSAGVDTINNSGLIATSGTTTLAFGTGVDVFNNRALGTLRLGEILGASLTTITGLESFSNLGTVSLQDGETNDILSAAGTAYDGLT